MRRSTQHYIAHDIKIVLAIGINRQRIIDAHNQSGEFDSYLNAIKTAILASGLHTQVLAIQPGEEWFTALRGRGLPWPEFQHHLTPTEAQDMSPAAQEARRTTYLHDAALLKLGLEKVNDRIRAIIPGKYIVASDTQWNNDPNIYGWQYYAPAPSNADILNLNAYMSYIGISEDCGPQMQAKFLNEVAARYDWAAAHFSQPLMMTGQAFQGFGDFMWPIMPATCHLDWFYQYAQSNPKILAIAWFSYASVFVPPDKEHRGVSHPLYPDRKDRLNQIYAYNQSLP